MENEDVEVEKYFGEIENKKSKRKLFTEDDVLDIVDKCFHYYASDFRNDAKEWAQEIMSE